MSDKTFQLLTQKGPAPGKVFKLDVASVIVGRDPSSGLVIEDLEVSRQHARLIKTPTGYQVQDMGSTNGTFVEGKRLGGEPVALTAGQVVMFGSNVELIFQVIADIDPMATMIAPAAAIKVEPKAPPAAPKPEPEPEPEPEFDFDDLPDFGEPEVLPVVEEKAAPLPATEPLVEEEPGFATVIDSSPVMAGEEAAELPQFSSEGDDDGLPDFGSEPSALPRFDDAPAAAAPPPLPAFDSAPPAGGGKPPKGDSGGGGFFSNRRNVIIVVVVAVLLLCCCVIAIGSALVYSGTIQLDNMMPQFFALARTWAPLL